MKGKQQDLGKGHFGGRIGQRDDLPGSKLATRFDGALGKVVRERPNSFNDLRSKWSSGSLGHYSLN
jgi:hypothetical protein